MEVIPAEKLPDSPAGPVPDLMNDPQYATNLGSVDDGSGDPDTCRICRGEAADQEPLFYPCKCSGSIKFVHQDCLMEWLSHSQKKHCELCKTPFRFTKLYASNMPPTLPVHLFIRHLIVHTIKNTALSLRICLVVFVWLGCLPFMMRHIWGFLFWLGDGGWISNQGGMNNNVSPTQLQVLALAKEGIANMAAKGTSPASPLLAQATTPASSWKILEKLPGLFRSNSPILNINSSEPLLLSFFKTLYNGLGFESASGTANALENTTDRSQLFANHQTGTADRPSLLSEVSLLKNITRHTRLNDFIITTLEGQVITIIVVVCFILVFLIREWVVQQQPGINMGAGFNAEFAAGDRVARNRNAMQEPDVEHIPAILEAEENEIARPLLEREPLEIAARPIARARRRQVRFDEGAGNETDITNLADNGSLHTDLQSQPRFVDDYGNPSSSNTRLRPTIPTRDALPPAAEIQRHLTEESPYLFQDRLDAGEFVLIWRRADGSPEEVLKIIEAEGLGEKLRYWKNAMIALQQADPENANSSEDQPVTNNMPASQAIVNRSESEGNEGAKSVSKTREDISESWLVDHSQDVPEPLFDVSIGSLPGFGSPSMRQLSIGMSSAEGSTARSFGSASGSKSAGRPRAVSEGPQLKENISPLANNNWSIADVPPSPSTSSNTGRLDARHDQSWKTAQDLRVQQAIFKGREAQALQQTTSAVEEENQGPITIRRGDELIVAESWDKFFADHPFKPDSEREPLEDHREAIMDDGHLHSSRTTPEEIPELEEVAPLEDNTMLEDITRLEDTPLLETTNIIPPAPREPPEGLLGHIADWLWGDMDVGNDGQLRDDEHIVQDIAAEAPFVPVAHRPANDHLDVNFEADFDGDGIVHRENADAIAAGIDPNDPDGLDDPEDFEGIMELVGMRGPLIGLVQNGLFSAVLISLTVACGVWIPYNVGRLALLLVAKPLPLLKLHLKLVFSCAAFMQDLALVLLGSSAYLVVKLCALLQHLFSYTGQLDLKVVFANPGFAMDCLKIGSAAASRIADGVIGTIVQIPESEVPGFSAVSHEALLHIKTTIKNILYSIGSVLTSRAVPMAGEAVATYSPVSLTGAWIWAKDLNTQIIDSLSGFSAGLAGSRFWMISLDMPERVTPLDPALSYWSGTDRFWAIISGYVAFSLLGALYLKKGSPFSSSQTGREWEATLIDLLHQAGGVMKVILIISIEMLVFPLYCGLLLDLALLPLFQNATIVSRVVFTFENPLTSVFVHWFVGTCYMFHFALFVSMCRKIMRSGVLYFIRDPDDPTFHPVRDVLERNVSTQLRKITFSAMVYGALVVVCLGGVVWSLAFAFETVLPIHWSSNEPVLEFPIDLLFYNFFMPLAAKFFKPSDGLYAMYAWWFRKCARLLRLTWFLFDERKMDEEGHHIRRSWIDSIWGIQGDVTRPVKPSQVKTPFDEDQETRAYFRQDGKYVRTPASDQVRITKGHRVFIEVDEENNRLDGAPDVDEGLHGRKSDHFKMVYIPPYFRGRIFLFMLSIWVFAAVTGVCITVVPLVLGRQIFAKLIPTHVQKNDVYAFSIGIYILGSILYCLFHIQEGISYGRNLFTINAQTPIKILRKMYRTGLWIMRMVYAYSAFALVLPAFFSLVVEFYFIVPVHTYFALSEAHVIHFVQSWTLGLLYVKLATRFILWHADSRPAEALRAVTRNGYLDPDIRIATRCFILPATVILSTALLVPFFLAWLITTYTTLGDTVANQTLVYRYAYPGCLSLIVNGFGAWMLLDIMKGWRMRIRDEVYLIGERLHNFGDRNKSGAGALIPSTNRIET